MRILNLKECAVISGTLSQPQLALIGAAAITGGMLTGMTGFAIAFSPLGPVIGATAGVLALGALCTQFAPTVATLGCGVAGGVLGYNQGPIILAGATMYAGAAASGLLAYHKLTN